MGKNKITILLLAGAGILIAGFGFSNLAKAADSSVYVLPASLSKEVGDVFDVSVKVNPAGEKVCMVEGKMSLTKLSCQKVLVADGLMASPDNKLTCDNLYFALGIPGCAASEKTLFTVTLKAESSGTAAANFSGVDIIGEGVSISSASSGGVYTLTSCSCGNWNSWQDGVCGGGNCSSEQRLQIRTRTCAPTNCLAEQASRCVEDSTCISTSETAAEPEIISEQEIITEQEPEPEFIQDLEVETSQQEQELEVESTSTSQELVEETSQEQEPEWVQQATFLAAISKIFSLGTDNTLLGVLIAIIILIVVIALIFYFFKKSRRRQS